MSTAMPNLWRVVKWSLPVGGIGTALWYFNDSVRRQNRLETLELRRTFSQCLVQETHSNGNGIREEPSQTRMLQPTPLIVSLFGTAGESLGAFPMVDTLRRGAPARPEDIEAFLPVGNLPGPVGAPGNVAGAVDRGEAGNALAGAEQGAGAADEEAAGNVAGVAGEVVAEIVAGLEDQDPAGNVAVAVGELAVAEVAEPVGGAVAEVVVEIEKRSDSEVERAPEADGVVTEKQVASGSRLEAAVDEKPGTSRSNTERPSTLPLDAREMRTTPRKRCLEKEGFDESQPKTSR